jgi:uncharacterized protein
VLAGALNAVAGGGSFLTLPALLHAGVGPVAANATSTMALLPGSMSSAWAYRREWKTGRGLVLLALVSVVGGLIGALLLVRTSDSAFLRLLPWLMLVGAATFSAGEHIAGALGRPDRQADDSVSDGETPPLWALAVQLAIATYGGYFGGGMGIMMLAVFAAMGMTRMHEMNGVKSLLAVAINGVALVEFLVSESIAWSPGLVMVAGALVGGYVGASIARRQEGPRVRQFALVVAWSMTVFFFWRGSRT